MKLLVAAGNLGYFGETDGVVTIYKNLIQRYKKEKIKADVVVYGPEDRIYKDGSVRIIEHKPIIPLRVDPAREIDVALLWDNLRHKLKGPYDLVESSTPDSMGMMASRIAKRDKAPFIIFYHTELSEYARIRALDAFPWSKTLSKIWSNLVYLGMEKWLGNYYQKGDATFAISNYVAQKMKEKYGKEATIIGGGLDTKLFHPKKKKTANHPPRAIYVGRVVPEKNLEWLVDIFSRNIHLPLTVVGDGPYLNYMKKKLPNARFTGRLGIEECAKEYQKSDYLVFPSKTDTYGLVVLEAMSSGIPAIVTNQRGPKELVQDGINGFVTKSKKEFEERILELSIDDKKREEMGKNAREYARTKSWDAFFQNMLRAYKSILKNSPKEK